jgi:hypothetical protein
VWTRVTVILDTALPAVNKGFTPRGRAVPRAQWESSRDET